VLGRRLADIAAQTGVFGRRGNGRRSNPRGEDTIGIQEARNYDHAVGVQDVGDRRNFPLIKHGHRSRKISAEDATARVMLLGGASIGPRFIWWNLVSSRRERIEQAKIRPDAAAAG
jgi:Pirin C-terminal cupin domain